jgi:hypothetical protein
MKLLTKKQIQDKAYRDKNQYRICKYREQHKEKQSEYAREWRLRNREWLLVAKRNTYDYRTKRNKDLTRKYNITLEEWELLFQSQNNCCAICKSSISGGRGWTTDHCHDTGKIRGILCNNCNARLLIKTCTIEILQNAINYLRKSQCV